MGVLSWLSARRGYLQFVLLPVSVFKMYLVLTPLLPFQLQFSMNFEVLVRFLPDFLLFLHHCISCRHKRFRALPYKPRLGYSWLMSPSTRSLHSMFVKDCLGRGNVCISWHCMYRGRRESSRSTEVLCKQDIYDNRNYTWLH